MEKVTVVIPCYNDGAYIEKSIDSVRTQTYKNIEIIVVDDGSTDSVTKDLLKHHTWEQTEVIYANNKGPAAARNLGIQKGTGTYILPLDADDYIHPSYIEKAVKALEEDKTRGIVYCEAALFGKEKGKWDLPPYTLKEMLVDNVIFVTALFRKEDWVMVGGFDETMVDGMEDYDFWLSLIEAGREVYQITETLFYYRKKEASRTMLFQKELDTVVATYDHIYKKHHRLYEQAGSSYTKESREIWVKRMMRRQKIKARLGILNHLVHIPIVKKALKKYLIKP